MVAEEWAHSEGEESCGSTLDGEDVCDTDVESWASIEEADWANEESSAKTDSARSSASKEYLQVQSSEDPEDSASAATTHGAHETKLYDSGASRHISPFHHCFLTYQPITPCPISAADKQIFYAIGTGTLQIQVPNRVSSTPILLREALHAPNIGTTVVSIGWIAKAGYTILFDGDTCKIKNKNDSIIGRIPVGQNGLYWVEHEQVGATILEDNGILAVHQ
jgi:hypothetical protein